MKNLPHPAEFRVYIKPDGSLRINCWSAEGPREIESGEEYDFAVRRMAVLHLLNVGETLEGIGTKVAESIYWVHGEPHESGS